MSELLSEPQIRRRRRLTHLVGAAAFVFAAYSLVRYLSADFPATRAQFARTPDLVAILIFWTLAPPAWFFVEHFWLWGGADDAMRARVAAGQALAKPFWAAVLATLLFLVPK